MVDQGISDRFVTDEAGFFCLKVKLPGRRKRRHLPFCSTVQKKGEKLLCPIADYIPQDIVKNKINPTSNPYFTNTFILFIVLCMSSLYMLLNSLVSEGRVC